MIHTAVRTATVTLPVTILRGIHPQIQGDPTRRHLPTIVDLRYPVGLGSSAGMDLVRTDMILLHHSNIVMLSIEGQRFHVDME